MLKTHWRLISILERLGDNIIILACFFLAYDFRDDILAWISFAPAPEQTPVLAPISDYYLILALAIPLFNFSLAILGGYKSMRFSSKLQLLRIASSAAALVFVAIGFFLFVLKLDLSRSFVGTFCVLVGIGIFFVRYAVLRYLRYWRARGKNFRNMLIVGTGEQAVRLYHEISKSSELGIRVVGFVLLDSEPVEINLPADVVANIESFEDSLKRFAIDEVLFTEIFKHYAEVYELAQIAIEEGVKVTMAADLFSLGILKSDTSTFASIPLVHFHAAPLESSAMLVKRFVDIGISSTMLVVLSPLMIFTALAIKLDSPGPVFFRQRRVGLNGRLFVLLKFRSMFKGAERKQSQLMQYNEMNGPVFKMSNDPRVTRVGKVLRKLSLDELPQLINVLRGDMSLVGPRPPLPSEVKLYERKYRRRLSMRPGITCTWQVSGRNEIPDFDEWIKLDLEYIDNWSLGRDFKLLLRTIPAVISGTGAR